MAVCQEFNFCLREHSSYYGWQKELLELLGNNVAEALQTLS